MRILAFPSNDFRQELKTNEEIKNFAANYNVKFDMYSLISVNGKNAHPLWVYMKSKQGGGILGSSIKWNFAKFVIDKEGIPVARFGTTEDPIPKVLEKCMSLF